MKHYFIFILLIGFAVFATQAQTSTGAATLKVEGEVETPLTLSSVDIANMKHVAATIKDRDGKTYIYSGVPVTDILKQAGVTMDKELRGENLSKYLLVRAADSYEVLFSLAELDSSYTDRVILLADKMDNKPLPAGKGAFRIIVPGEKKPARCVFEVTTFVIRFAKE